MCQGQFSPLDPRCGNFNRTTCFWCGVSLHPPNWDKKERQKDHLPNCPMYQLWEEGNEK